LTAHDHFFENTFYSNNNLFCMVFQDLESAQADLSRAPAGSATSMTPLFGASADELSKLSEDGNTEYLEQLGGVGFSYLPSSVDSSARCYYLSWAP
jgi:hypothetical protein